MTTTRRVMLTLGVAAYAGTVLLANVLIEWLGIIDLEPGAGRLMAPAAVLAVGLSLVVRDVLHDLSGRAWPLTIGAGIALGGILSAILAQPGLALASVIAFTVAELVDSLAYVPLRRRGFTIAALVSSAVGLVLDSVLFLTIAPQLVPGVDNLELLNGQLVGKAIAVGATVLLVNLARAGAGNGIDRRRRLA
jgi:uncharacterized PurR-regulated membrane protein YhhQ (DUF165 family)